MPFSFFVICISILGGRASKTPIISKLIKLGQNKLHTGKMKESSFTRTLFELFWTPHSPDEGVILEFFFNSWKIDFCWRIWAAKVVFINRLVTIVNLFWQLRKQTILSWTLTFKGQGHVTVISRSFAENAYNLAKIHEFPIVSRFQFKYDSVSVYLCFL